MRKSKGPAKPRNDSSFQPAPKKSKTSLPEYAKGETEETCKEHEATLKKEMQKTNNRNLQLIKQLMDLTYPYRRQMILHQTITIPEIMRRFPALQLVTEFKAEVARVLETPNAVTKFGNLWSEKWQTKILKLAKESASSKSLIEAMNEELEENPDKRKEIESTASVLGLSKLMKMKKGVDIVKICSDDESVDDEILKSDFPRIVAAGQLCKLEPLYIVAEKEILLRLRPPTSMPHVLVILLGAHYVFNINYQSGIQNFFFFLETVLLEKKEHKHRVSIHKFLKDLS